MQREYEETAQPSSHRYHCQPVCNIPPETWSQPKRRRAQNWFNFPTLAPACATTVFRLSPARCRMRLRHAVN